MRDERTVDGPGPRLLAQANIARMRHPLHSGPMAGFATALEHVDALADRSPGFVWRLRGEDGEHPSLADVTGDPLMIINLSLWESYAHLHDFVYRSDHADLLKRRSRWFDPLEPPTTVLWWVPSDHRPTSSEAITRLRHLRRYGPEPRAFDLRVRFDAHGRPEGGRRPGGRQGGRRA